METPFILGIAVVLATFFGPVVAVIMTRWIDDSRASKGRRMEVFRALMRTRRRRLSAPHVEALNLVEIEFYGIDSVSDAYKAYIAHLNNAGPETSSDPKIATQWAEQSSKLLTRLLAAMGTELKYDLEQLDVLDGGYTPQGWGNIETANEALRNAAIDLLSGKTALLVKPKPD